MKTCSSIIEALGINNRNKAISVVGGGGKTSLVYRMTEDFLTQRKKVIITTTTHMRYEPNRPFAQDGDIEEIKNNIEKNGYTFTGVKESNTGKIASLKKITIDELINVADVILIEADGSRGLPLKVPAQWEPVIPEISNLVIGVMGLDALGKQINKICHRSEMVADFLEKNCEDYITETDMIKIASSPKGLKKNCQNRGYRVFLNKCDIMMNSTAAHNISMRMIHENHIISAYGSLKNNIYNY